MNCEEFDEILEELERDSAMKASVRAAGLDHAEHCSACRARLAEARLLSLELRNLAKHDEQLRAPVELEFRLVAAFRERRRRSSVLWRKLAWSGAVAAMLLFGWVLAERPWRGEPRLPEASLKSHAAIPATPVHRAAIVAENGSRNLRLHRSPRKTAPGRAAAGVSAPLESEATTSFVPLPYGDTDYPVGDGMMVRVQLPRSAPALVGFPMTPGSEASGPVTADVVIGEDGVARAIRFVSPGESGNQPEKINFDRETNQGEPQ